MDNFITASATLRYDPLPNTKHFEKWWCLATMSFDFIKLYNYFLKKHGVDLDIGTPYSTHISVIKGEKPKFPENWGYMDGHKIKFWYEPCPYGNNDKHVWIDCYSNDLLMVRQKLGLPLRKRFHITIGRLLK